MTSYNALGQKNSLTYPDGATYRYTYDANNQLSTVNLPTGPNANTASITFNSYQWTVPTQITLPGGTVRTQDYDGLLRVKDISVKDPGQSQVLNYQYGYDLTNNIVSKATEAGATSYSYDSLDHLTGATYTNQTTPQTNETYTYDPVANRITDHRTTAAWTYNENNQLETADSISYTYDDNGNTTNQTDANGSTGSPQARNYTYDTDNRLIEVRDAGSNLIAAYSYDPFGRRLSKDTGTQKTYYFYNAEGLIAEADASGQIIKSYGYAPGSTASTGSAQAFSTNPLWLKAAAMGSQTQGYYYYQNDHLGTPMKLLNQSGVTVWSATYDGFGRATVDSASTVSNNLRYPGQYYDAETGLHYNWNRYYDPVTGRYSTSDPIGLLGGINMYAYVEGNPVGYIDPTGEFIPQALGFAFGAGLEYLTNPCAKPSDIFLAGVIGALGGGISKTAFLRYGPKSLTRETGKEWSHSISRKTVNRNTSGSLNRALNRRGGLNGSWRSPQSHAAHDPSRHVAGVDPLPLPMRVIDRIPDWLKGTALGGGVGAGMAGGDCGCS